MKMNSDVSSYDDSYDSSVVDIVVDEEDPSYDQDSQYGDLPTLESYKTDKEIREQKPRSRVGLITFVCLVLLLIIITAIAVPLSIRDSKAKTSSSASGSGSGSGSSTFTGSNSAGTLITASPNARPTRPPTPPPVSYAIPRDERAKTYLTDSNLASASQLSDPNSPQAKATKWITELDDYAIEIPESGQGTDSRFTERWALAVFYYQTDGDTWKYKMNFLDPTDHCDWYGLFVNGDGRVVRYGVTECQKVAPAFDIDKVTRIEFVPENNVRGSIPTEIKYLSELRTWITPFNAELSSTLDPFLALPKLEHLELQYCNINGQIPSNIGSMQQLSFVGLGNNNLVGAIPESFFSLSNLVVLGLDDNLLESTIDKFARFTKMQKLYIEDNLISGEITAAMVTMWRSMVDLDVSVNRLTGPLPSNLFTSMLALEVIDLHGNDFIGNIPDIGEYHESLRFFAVQDNSLVGNIPESFANASELRHIDITANLFTLPFPSRMKEMTSLESLHTGINGFTNHPVPDFLASMPNLREISMKQNSLTGQIPTFLGGLTNLKILDLDFNELTGPIPSELGNLRDLVHLLLNRNFLTGTLPTSFSELNNIGEQRIMLLDGNELSGDTSVLCNNPNVEFHTFSADCDEISCPCCTICCNDSDPNCNNKDWRITLDGIWEYDFQRIKFIFGDEVLPAGAKDAYTNGGGRF